MQAAKKRFFVSRPDSGVVRQRQAAYAQAEAKPAPVAKTPRKLGYQERLELQGRRLVQFVVPIELWNRFLELRCDGGLDGVPNRKFIAWLEEQTRQERQKIPGEASA